MHVLCNTTCVSVEIDSRKTEITFLRGICYMYSMYHKSSQVVAQCHFGASNLKVSETRESHIYKPGIPPKLTVIMMQVDYI